jgi:hypothetical protein
MAITMVALAMALVASGAWTVASGAWTMAMVLAMALGAMEVMAGATSVPLSTADTGPLGFIEKMSAYDDDL